MTTIDTVPRCDVEGCDKQAIAQLIGVGLKGDGNRCKQCLEVDVGL